MWEANNVLSNFDPAARRMVLATDGSITDRALVESRSQQLRRRGSASPTRSTPKTVVRGGWGVSYVAQPAHRRRRPAADQRPAGDQRGRQSDRPRRSGVPSDRAGLSGRPDRSVDASTRWPSNITLHPERLPLRPRAELVRVGAARAAAEHAARRRLRRQPRRRPGADRQLNQAAPNNAAGSLSLQARRPIPEFADITYVFNGGKSRYDALQTKYEWRLRAT